jgi:YHS domain-containing protein
MKKIAVVMGAVLVMVGSGIALAQEVQPADKEATAQAVKKQTVCPIMGGKINTKVFADYDGKRVYFCCGGCPAKFKEDPAKYIAQMEADGIKLDKTPETDTKSQTTDVGTVPARNKHHSAQGCGCGGCGK